MFKESPPTSEDYCIDTMWKSKDDVLNLGFSEADEQLPCANNSADPFNDDVGLSFDLYRWEPNDAYACKLDAQSCELNCNVLSGKFNTDDGNCYELKALQKLCMKVDFQYLDNQPAAEALYVSDVRVTAGCFIGGAVGMYSTVPLN